MRWDLILLIGCGLFFGWAWTTAAQGAQADASNGLGVRGAVLNAPTDDYALELPDGVTIDPQSGLLVGVALKGDANTTVVTWELLKSYEYQSGLKGLSEDLRALDGKQVVMLGFQMASYEYDDIREFFLVASHWSCCYGVPAGINGAVHVNIKDGNESLALTTRPLKVVGTMRVREMKDSGIVMAIYAIEDAQAEEMVW